MPEIEGSDKKSPAAAAWSWEGSTATVQWASLGLSDTFDVMDFPEPVRFAGLLNGFEQTLRDAYALPNKKGDPVDPSKPDGLKKVIKPTVEQKRAAFLVRLETLQTMWSAPRGEGGEVFWLRAAMMERYPKSFPDAPTWDGWLDAQVVKESSTKTAVVAKLAANSKNAEIIERLKSEKGIIIPDADAMLDELDEAEAEGDE